MSNDPAPTLPSEPQAILTNPSPTPDPAPAVEPTPNPTPAPEPKPAAPEFDFTEVGLDVLKGKLPEGLELNEPLATEFLTLLNGAKSRTELAEGLMEMQLKVGEQAVEAMTKQWNDMQDGWKAAMRDDAKVGGANLNANLAKAQELINLYAEDAQAVKELFALTGVGNNVHMLKMLLKMASALPTESAPVQGNPPAQLQSRAARLFTS